MCLDVLNYDRPTEVQEVYKVVRVNMNTGKMFSPVIYNNKVKFGWYRARRLLYFLRFKKIVVQSHDGPVIRGGAIHVFTTLERAISEFRYVLNNGGCKILKCKANPSDFIANGARDQACYTKIFIPREGNE